MSFAASQEGVGKSFGIQELLDQLGAFLGPVLLYLVMLVKTEGTTFTIYATCFAVLAIPGAITLALLFYTKHKFPHPERFEPEPKQYVPFKIQGSFIKYIVGISLFAFGFIDYALIVMHLAKNYVTMDGLLTVETLPLVYAGAMLVDAVAALFFGYLYDKQGIKALVISTILAAPFAVLVFGGYSVGVVLAGLLLWGIGMGAQESILKATVTSLVPTILAAPFAVLVFGGYSVGVVLAGLLLWGIGMGAQESILKATVTSLVPKASRATGYGIFECAFGIFWFLGSWLLGILYDYNLHLMIIISVMAQLVAVPFYLSCKFREIKEKS